MIADESLPTIESNRNFTTQSLNLQGCEKLYLYSNSTELASGLHAKLA